MASLEDNLNQLLSDPNAMEQIFSLAGKLGMSSEPSGEPEAEEQPLSEREPEAAELSQPLFGAEGLGGLGKLLEIFQGSQQTAQEADALLDALRPFLRQERQEKLDRAADALRARFGEGAILRAKLLYPDEKTTAPKALGAAKARDKRKGEL